ncbi:MAG: N-acetyltransferase [Nitrospirae bacterium]|nr:N-acetyltransferase [Nitrospirota bacterium]
MKEISLRILNGTGLGKRKPRKNVASDVYLCIAPDVKVGKSVKFSKFINLYGCEVGDETKIGAFVEIQKNAKVGKRCKISSHTFICEGVTIEDEVFVGHNVTFVNDSFPRATSSTGTLQTEADWKVEVTLVKRGAAIGSGATILSNVVIGENALIGAGSVVTSNVPANAVVTGNPGRVVRYIDQGHDSGGQVDRLKVLRLKGSKSDLQPSV